MLGPESAKVLCCMDVVRQGCHLTSETESRSGLTSFVSVKVATVIRRINRNAVCATAGAVVTHKVVRNGFDWPNKLQDSYVTTDGL